MQTIAGMNGLNNFLIDINKGTKKKSNLNGEYKKTINKSIIDDIK